MHVENELVEFMTEDEQEYEEVIEEYEEEILVQEEEVPEPLRTDWADTPPSQDKPRCITLILNNHWKYIYIYMMCIYVIGFIMKLHV